MEDKVSEILENILSLMDLEGSFEVDEGQDEVSVSIETKDAARLIGVRGETLAALQLLLNQIVARSSDQYKRIVVDVLGWRKRREAEVENRARSWAKEVLESGQPLELDPMPSWQRRIIHLVLQEVSGVESESVGEGADRRVVIKPATPPSPTKVD